MIAAAVFKCVMLAGFHVEVIEVPVTEYETANISKLHNGAQFEAQVLEGRLNSVSIEIPEIGAKTMSYSFKDYQQRSLSTNLSVNNTQASIDCEINQVPVK